jgi:ADP-ribose pyrophosphatase YjhB (NUDIX family)
MPVPEFVRELREMIGQHPLWMPGVTAVVLDSEGRVLLGRRSDTGKWALITGILDPGEQPAAGTARECLEETGVEVVVERLTSVTVSPPLVHVNGDRAQYLELTFRCRAVGGEARVNDDESLEVGWFDLDELPEDVGPRQRQRLTHALSDKAEAWFVGADDESDAGGAPR